MIGWWSPAVAQASGTSMTGWFITGGALVVLAVGVGLVLLARSSRRDEVDDRIAVRLEAAAAASPEKAPGVGIRAPARSEPTFVDLPRLAATGHVDVHINKAENTNERKSPMSAYDPGFDGEQPETFIDLPGSERTVDPVIDLTDETVDLTEERQDAAPKGDPWS